MTNPDNTAIDLDDYRTDNHKRVLARLERPEHIRDSAVAAANHLKTNDCVTVILIPGDATRYVINLARPDGHTISLNPYEPELASTDNWLMVSCRPACRQPYLWYVRRLPTNDYTFEHFVSDPHTAAVLAEFLIQVSIAFKGMG